MNNQEFIVTFINFMHKHRNKVREIMDTSELYYGQHPILEVIQNLGECTQRELVGHLRVTPPSITTSIKRLEKRGLVYKKKIGRKTLITLTDEGLAITKSTRAQMDELDTKVLIGVSEEEKQLVVDIIKRMSANIDKEQDI